MKVLKLKSWNKIIEIIQKKGYVYNTTEMRYKNGTDKFITQEEYENDLKGKTFTSYRIDSGNHIDFPEDWYNIIDYSFPSCFFEDLKDKLDKVLND